jgi:hypothetical protein
MRPFDDTELGATRRTHYGTPTTAERCIVVILEHNHYHAGEINHLRSLLQSDEAGGNGPSGER